MIKLNRLAAALLAIGAASPAKASLITVDLDKNVEYTQSSANGPLTLNGYFFAARAFYGNTGDFDSGNLSYPGTGSPQAFTSIPFGTV